MLLIKFPLQYQNPIKQKDLQIACICPANEIVTMKISCHWKELNARQTLFCCFSRNTFYDKLEFQIVETEVLFLWTFDNFSRILCVIIFFSFQCFRQLSERYKWNPFSRWKLKFYYLIVALYLFPSIFYYKYIT